MKGKAKEMYGDDGYVQTGRGLQAAAQRPVKQHGLIGQCAGRLNYAGGVEKKYNHLAGSVIYAPLFPPKYDDVLHRHRR